MKILFYIYEKITKIILYFLIGYIVYNSLFSGIEFKDISVTAINIISTVLLVFIGGPLGIAGAMANDSGRGGFTIIMFQFLTLSYPLVFLIGLISSISVLYSNFENKEYIARILASISAVQLLIILVIFGFSLLLEHYKKRLQDKGSGDNYY